LSRFAGDCCRVRTYCRHQVAVLFSQLCRLCRRLPDLSRAVVRWSVTRGFSRLWTPKRNPVVRRDTRVIGALRPFEDVASFVADDGTAHGLTASGRQSNAHSLNNHERTVQTEDSLAERVEFELSIDFLIR
jgi:hypothetical protein